MWPLTALHCPFLSGRPSWCLQTICMITIFSPAKQDSADLFVNCSADGGIVSLCTWPFVRNCWLMNEPHPALFFRCGETCAFVFTIKTNKEHKDIYYYSDSVIWLQCCWMCLVVQHASSLKEQLRGPLATLILHCSHATVSAAIALGLHNSHQSVVGGHSAGLVLILLCICKI